MHQDWRELAEDLNPLVAALRSAQPDVMKGFSQMAQAALKTEALDTKTKELIALAISVAMRCAPCITFHAKGAVRAGASEAELAETMGLSVYMGAGPSVMYAAQALEAAEQWRQATA
ncbi:MAG: carboxymuconolactone decarboxylase family protein [Alphaproteobacteria bacterium]|nr:carboxymuconolactone decarboxylase family protein [Alphaproteobacteria bacterium]